MQKSIVEASVVLPASAFLTGGAGSCNLRNGRWTKTFFFCTQVLPQNLPDPAPILLRSLGLLGKGLMRRHRQS